MLKFKPNTSSAMKKKSPIYKKSSGPFKMKSPLKKPKLTPAQQARYDRRMARQERRAKVRSNMSQSNFSKTKAPAWTF